MSPRARRSDSITLPPGNHPGLIRYNDDKSFSSEKPVDADTAADDESATDGDFDCVSNDCYESNDPSDDGSILTNRSSAVEAHER